RPGPMNQSFHTLRPQIFPQFIPLLRPNHVVLVAIEMAIASKMRQAQTVNIFQALAVKGGDLAAVLNPGREMAQLYLQHRSLHVIQQRGIAMVVEFAGLAVLTVEADKRRKPGYLRIVGSNCASVSKSSQRLERVEAETSCSKRPSSLPLIVGPQRLGCVLNDG